MTLNQIINKIKTQAESHKMVGKFAVGAEFDFAVEEVKYYPLVWLVPNGFTFNTDARLVSYQFAMLVMDRQFESSSNTIEVLSDTAGIIVDIVTLIKRNVTETDFDISVNGQADPFFDSSHRRCLLVMVLILLLTRPTSKVLLRHTNVIQQIIIIREIYAVDKKHDSIYSTFRDSLSSLNHADHPLNSQTVRFGK